MATFLPDTNCIIARVSEQHPHHAAVRAELDRRLARGETMIVAAHTLVEAFSVLTRIPLPDRMPAQVARQMLETSFVEGVPVIALDAPSYLAVLGACADQGIVGGLVYDALIAACARLGGADTLLTFNARHFARYAGADLRITVPAER